MANTYQTQPMKQVLGRLIRSKMDLAGVTYKQLSGRLESVYGISHNPNTLRNKVNTGALGAQMLLYVMFCLNVESLDLVELEKMYTTLKEEA